MNKIIRNQFDLFSEWVGDRVGKPSAFLIALSLVFVWAGFGPVSHFSETWQLVINTGTTIATFLMVFLLQNTQNRDDSETKASLRDIIEAQKVQLESSRHLAERLTAIEYQLDRLDEES